MDAFYTNSRSTQKLNVGEEIRAVYLSALLKGKALEVYSRLPVKDAQDYEVLKDALLKRFNLTEESFKQKFKTAKPELNEAPGQFLARLESYLMRWIELAVSSGPNFVESRKFKAASTSKECARPSYVVCPWSEMT